MARAEPAKPPLLTFFWTGTVAAFATAGAVAIGWTGWAAITDPPTGQVAQAVAFALMVWVMGVAFAWPVWMVGLYTVGLGAWWVLRRREVGAITAVGLGAGLAGTVAFILGWIAMDGGRADETLPIAVAFAAAVAVCGGWVGWQALRSGETTP